MVLKISRFLLITTLCFGQMILFAQKHDYVWLSGYDSNVFVDSMTAGYQLGITIMDFNNDPVVLIRDSLKMSFDYTNASFCDSEGQLRFYTNGVNISNEYNEFINNSELNPGYILDDFDTSQRSDGYRTPQGAIFLPSADYNELFLFHSLRDTAPGSNQTIFNCGALYETVINPRGANQHGSISAINQIVIRDSMLPAISAVKHANGRDWWVLMQRTGTNCFYRILVDAGGSHILPTMACLGEPAINGDINVVCFSPNGNRFAQITSWGVCIFDFDRCSGQLFNPLCLPIPSILDSFYIGIGVSFSPNSRFLYVTRTTEAYQIDLSNPAPFDHIDTIARFDGFALPFGSYFNTPQLAPDGKIYISCGNSEEDYHVINNPDGLGQQCNFAQHGLRLPTLSIGVPNFPNYRLGALAGSGCDTLTAVSNLVNSESDIRVFPNPCSASVVIDYGFINGQRTNVKLEIQNMLGDIFYIAMLPRFSGYQILDVSNFAPGFYNAIITDDGGIIGRKKFIKQ